MAFRISCHFFGSVTQAAWGAFSQYIVRNRLEEHDEDADPVKWRCTNKSTCRFTLGAFTISSLSDNATKICNNGAGELVDGSWSSLLLLLPSSLPSTLERLSSRTQMDGGFGTDGSDSDDDDDDNNTSSNHNSLLHHKK
jgi:hypothetical protein